MDLPFRIRRLTLNCWVLSVWMVFCVGWIVVARKPWHTLALDRAVSVKLTPLDDFVAAGLWWGLLISGSFAGLLLATHRWWGGAEPAPVMAGARSDASALPLGWWILAVGALVGVAFWQCWPALGLSFWGDEAGMFTDFVHGQWHTRTKVDHRWQEAIRFKEVPWKHAFFSDPYGANHWFSTHLQRVVLRWWQCATHQPVWRFEEWVVRLVPLVAGLGAIVAMAGWLRWLGRPLAGLVAAAILAIHPSHIRFCVEARGYSWMLLFFILTLWASSRALRVGRKRDWVAVGLCQFLMLYSWKGAIYGLAFVNAVLVIYLVSETAFNVTLRRVVLSRWFMAVSVGAMAFFPLTTSSQLQIRKSIGITRLRAKPMDDVWRNNLVAQTFLGVPWNEMERANPREVSVQRLRRYSPVTLPAVAVVGLALLLGAWRLWRQDRWLAWMSFSTLASGVAAAVHFKFGLRVELLTWYLAYQLPVVALLLGVAVTPGPVPASGYVSRGSWWPVRLAWVGLAAGALTAFEFLAGVMVADFRRHPRENYKEAVRLTRGAHEPAGFAGPSSIYTGWLWRHAPAYDPRGDTHVRTVEAMQEKSRLATESGGEFYMIVGMRHFSESVLPDVMERLRDPTQFDHLATLWGVEPLNTLDVYRLRRPGGKSPPPKR